MIRPVWIAALVAPAAVFVILLARPQADRVWENHPAHFWTVLIAAAASFAVGWAVSAAGRRRRDARLFLVSLACLASAGFLGLHALATPGVLLGKNAGFELATPVGPRGRLGVRRRVGARARAARVRQDPARSRPRRSAGSALVARRVGRRLARVAAAARRAARAGAARRLAAGARRRRHRASTRVAALGYLRLYRRRGARFVIAVTVAFALLAEAMIVIAWARNWHASWWEWHLLMLGVVPPHRRDRAHGVARGALQRALPRPDARGRARRQRAARRPQRLHVVLGATRAGGRHGDAERVLRRDRPAAWRASAARCTRSSATR